MAEERVQRRLAAILAADVVGYSRMMREDEAGTRARFNTHLDELIKTTIDSRQGRIVKTTGDGFLVEFASVVEAVQCELDRRQAAQDRMAEVLRISPHASIKDLRERSPFKDQAILERYLEALRKAGLPE